MGEFSSLPDTSGPLTGVDQQRQFPLSGFAYNTTPDTDTWTYVPADVIPNYSVQSPTEFTQFPLENGSIVSDHALIKPQTFEVTIHATNTPILQGVDGFELKPRTLDLRKSEFKAGGFLALSRAVQSLLHIGSPTQPQMTIKLLQGQGVDRINRLYESLLAIYYNSYRCMLTVNGRSYRNIYVTNLSNVRNGPAELGTFQLACQEVVFVSTGKAEARKPADSRNAEAANAGTKPAKKDPVLQDLFVQSGTADFLGFGEADVE